MIVVIIDYEMILSRNQQIVYTIKCQKIEKDARQVLRGRGDIFFSLINTEQYLI